MTVVKPEGIVSFSGSIFWGVCAGSAESVVAGGAAAGATGPDFGRPGGVLVVGALARRHTKQFCSKIEVKVQKKFYFSGFDK